MGIIAWIVLGLIAGAIAKALMPGNDPGGFIVTILIGIVGAFLGGFLGNMITGTGLNGFSLGASFSPSLARCCSSGSTDGGTADTLTSADFGLRIAGAPLRIRGPKSAIC